MTKAVAIDPGVTTGWALGFLDDGAMEVKSGQDEWKHIDLYKWLTFQQPDHVICESFHFRQSVTKIELFSRELIGVVNLFIQIRENIPLYMQTPSEALGGYFKNDKLKHDNLYNRGKPHANDAIRHLLHWFTFKEGYQFNQHGYR